MRLPRRPLQQVPIEGGDVGGVDGPCSSEPSRRESRQALDVVSALRSPPPARQVALEASSINATPAVSRGR